MTEVRRATLPAGIEIEYQETGTGDRPFVLVHGFTGSRDDWREHLPALSQLGRTIAIDQRGHGGSTNTRDPATYTLDQLVSDLDAFLGSQEIPSCDLLGHSLGGMVAIRLALRHPQRVASLVLMDTSPRGLEIMPRKAMEGGAHLVRTAGMPALAKVMREAARKLGNPVPATQRAVEAMGFDLWWDRIQAKYENMDPDAFVSLSRVLAEQEAVDHQLSEIRCPTTVIVGEQDAPFLKPSADLSAGIPGAQRVDIPDAAHSPQLENPPAWLGAIRAHLARTRRRAGGHS